MSSDPIADMLAKIMNAVESRHERVDIPRSKIKEQIVKVFQEEGFIKNYKCIEDRKQGIIRVYLKYGIHNEKIINKIKRISKPGVRKYSISRKIPQAQGGMGVTVVSTSKGIMTDKDAKKLKIGGEILCSLW